MKQTAIFGYTTETRLPDALGARVVFLSQHARTFVLRGHWADDKARAYADRHGIKQIAQVRHMTIPQAARA